MAKYDAKANEFLRRLPARLPADVAESVRYSFAMASTFAEKAADVRADGRLSVAGHSERIGEALRKGPLGYLAQARKSLTRHQLAAQAELAQLVLPVDRTDMFGEAQRQEIRAILRGMSDVERIRIVVESRDPQVKEAVIFASPLASGLPAEITARVHAEMLRERFGSRIDAAAELKDGLADAEFALGEAENDLRRESGLPEGEFQVAKHATAA